MTSRQSSLLTLLLALFGLIALSQQSRITGTLYIDPEHISFKAGVEDFTNKQSAAVVEFQDDTFSSGWALLNITATNNFPEDMQAYAAGYLEGYTTQKNIYDFYRNQYQHWGFKTFPPRLHEFMTKNLKFLETQALKNHTLYWQHVNLVLRQLHGLADGYKQRIQEEKRDAEALSLLELYFLNAAGDMENLVGIFSDTKFKKFGKYSDMVTEEFLWLTDCSALVKVLPDLSDIYFGHTTWRSFGIWNKMYKWYNFKAVTSFSDYTVSFASSPGFLSSKDDFYVMSTGLATMETTNSIFNGSLYSLVKPHSVLTWVRSIVANRMTTSGRDWTSVFSQYNSGTYDNQWMVLDYKKFQPGKPIQADTLWILEQIPGYCQSQDVSSVLGKQGFWSSYNVPYFETIYNVSGYPEKKAEHGDEFSYENCARAKIFRREQASIKDLMEFGRVLQFNEWKTDPFSLGDPAKSISARYDLRTGSLTAVPFGGIDSKITSFGKAKKQLAMGISGPTHQSADCPPFEWLPRWNATYHFGQPDRFDFGWIELKMN